MIPRYDIKEISYLWTDEAKFKAFLQVELELLKALEENGTIPSGITQIIREKAIINPQRINEIEEITRHDVIAFCTSITELIPPDISKYFHYGVTSSDIIDTALSLQIKQSLDIILFHYDQFLKSLYHFANKYRDLMTFGRSHGMYAEPMSFGQKFLGHWAELARRRQDLQAFYDHELTMQLSGAVGNYTLLSPAIENRVATHLKLKVETVSTQIIPRDRLAKLMSITALIANGIERLAIEIRHLHHSDIKELSEGFKSGQKGSSTMPHKKNPIATENLSGLSRFLRSHLNLALENSLLWHERDISHSSAERLYLPDHFGILTYILKRFKETITHLEIDEIAIENKVLDHAHYLSSYYLHFLIDKIPPGSALSKRETLYEIIQKISFSDDAKKSPLIFSKKLQLEIQKYHPEMSIPELSKEKIKHIYLKNTSDVFARALKEFWFLNL